MRASVNYYDRCIAVFVLFCFLFGPQKSDALTLPSTLKVDRNGKPRLAALVGKAIGLGTRVSLGPAESITVNVEAVSNRAVIRGNLKEIDIHVKHSRAPLLKLSNLVVHGMDLKLGWWPTLFSVSPFLLWKLRPSLFSILFYFGLYKLYSASQNYYHNQQQSGSSSTPTPLASFRKKLDGEPCFLEYEADFSDEDVGKSKLIRLGLNAILRNIMLTSVLGEAAAVADAFSALNSADSQTLRANYETQQRLLKGTETLSKDDGTVLPQSDIPKPIAKKNEQMLTKLLEATSFELVNTTFAANGKMLWNADAIFPESNGQTKLSYVLRTKPKVMASNQNNHMLAFADPECQFSLGAAIQGPFERFLPDLWIPVGPGVALSMGGARHRIRRVDVSVGKCQIHGRLSFFQKENKGLAERFRENLQLRLPSANTKHKKNPPKALKAAEDDET